jgi:glyoxylase-like metal-dependent hydrolase (beta-lactamase superfamily II)
MRNRVGAYLICQDAFVMLVDAGLGPHVPRDAGAGHLLTALEQLGVTTAMVNTVFLTHAHADHLGWVVMDGQPTFANASHLMGGLEFRLASDAVRAPLDVLERLGRLQLIDEPSNGLFGSGIDVIRLPGHTPGQLGLIVSSGDQGLLIAADALHHPAQVTHPEWQTPFDTDAVTARTTREQLIDRAFSDGLWLTASHFPGLFGRVVRDGRVCRWQV